MTRSIQEIQRLNQAFNSSELKGHDFAGTDIRGVNLSEANLRLAQFANARAGLAPKVKLLLLFGVAFLSILVGFISAYSSSLLGLLLIQGPIAVGIFFLAALIIFWMITFRYGIGSALGFICVTAAISIVTFVALIPSGELAGSAAVSSLILGGGIAGIVGLSVSLGVLQKPNLAVGLAVLGMVLGTAFSQIQTMAEAVVVCTLAPVTLLLSRYIASQMRVETDQRYRLIRQIVIQLSTYLGTSFKAANLTEANFSGAHLGRSDFRQAQLLRTNWRNAQLDQANFDGTYLENPILRRLLTTGCGKGKNFDRLDLRGLNLEDADLRDASFIGADLSDSNLRNADLSRAKLAQSQLYGADLSGTTLTGAFIQNWGISPETLFDDVHCDYIHMRLPTDQDPDPCRKPDNKSETFRPGDFADFIAPIIRTLDSYQEQNLDPRTLLAPKTLDLYHYEGIDPSAAAIALQQLIETHPQAEIEVRAIEGRGYQKVRIQAQIANNADPSQLNADYFDRYKELETLAYPDLQNMLSGMATQDSRIRSLETMMQNALGSDRFYAEPTKPKNILILAANPKNTPRIRIDEEVREIQNGLERARNRDKFVLQQRWAVTVRQLRRSLLDCKPNIVHFSGHGLEPSEESTTIQPDSPKMSATAPEPSEGLMLEDEQGNIKLVPSPALASLFEIFADEIDCLVLNACYSETQADAIVQHIPYVIGMNQAIGAQAAIEFSIGFYDGLLAGRSIETAYKLGCNAIQLQNIPGHLVPVLKRRDA